MDPLYQLMGQRDRIGLQVQNFAIQRVSDQPTLVADQWRGNLQLLSKCNGGFICPAGGQGDSHACLSGALYSGAHSYAYM